MLAGMLRALLVLAALLTSAGCSGDSDEPATTPSATPLSALDTTAIAVVRGEFCSRVAPASVEAALGGEASAADAYGNGEKADLAPDVRDVAHEYGCVWTAGDGTTARAWVFAPPVTAGQANRLQAAATNADGCERLPDAPRFGARSAAVRCSGDGGVVASYHGLFGDAWLSCSLGAPAAAADLAERAADWCAAILLAAG